MFLTTQTAESGNYAARNRGSAYPAMFIGQEEQEHSYIAQLYIGFFHDSIESDVLQSTLIPPIFHSLLAIIPNRCL